MSVTVPEWVRRDLLAALGVLRRLPPVVPPANGTATAGDGVAGSVVPTPLGYAAQLLYAAWFTRPATRAHLPAHAAVDSDLLPILQGAHAATGHLETGWHATGVGPAGRIHVHRHGESLGVVPGDYVNVTRPAAPVRVGDGVAVTARRELVDTASGWWTTFATAGAVDLHRMVRVYWNTPAAAVGPLVGALTTALELVGVRYTLKCPLSRSLCDRVDSSVLYVALPDWARVAERLGAVHARVAPHLRAETPPLTLRIYPGVGVAEDPGDGRSFGESRAAVVAVAALLARERAVTDDAAVAMMADHLQARGIPPQRPYLRPGSPPDLLAPWAGEGV